MLYQRVRRWPENKPAVCGHIVLFVNTACLSGINTYKHDKQCCVSVCVIDDIQQPRDVQPMLF